MSYPQTTIDLNGKKIIIETGHFGAQSSGAVTVTCGDTVVFAAVTAGNPREGIDYFPLSIEYQEKHYAGGVISSNRFIKREGRPSENEILTGRLIDRSLRPLFDQSSRNDVQIISYPLSIDGQEEPEILAVIAASAAVAVSHYPWQGPVGAVRIGLNANGEYLINPSNTEKETSLLDLVVSGPAGSISMVEAGAKEVSEEKMIGALNAAQSYIDLIVSTINDFAKAHGKEKVTLTPKVIADDVKKLVEKELGDLTEILKNEATKTGTQLSDLTTTICTSHPEINPNDIKEVAHDLLRDIARKQILDTKVRPDGRQVEEIRPINVEVGLLPRTHGSGYFQRGLTHVLSVATLASPARSQLLEGMKGESTKRYMHHYNMPGFASGEVGRPGTGRREIGHGALAERALLPVLPQEDVFPYAIRVVSEVLSSNGSTSQASVCGSTLALMDAGVPISKPVAGVAMGLITDEKQFITLTDICGLEDHLGDMDFKVAGTSDGITALQMDVKVPGINASVLGTAIDQAKRGRLEILSKMTAIIDKPRQSLSQYAPKIVSTKVPEDRIGEIIGSGGKTIRQIQADFGVEVDIDDTGKVTVTGTDQSKVDGARAYIDSLVAEAEIGATYQGTVARIEAFGAFVNILPGKDGLVHISQIHPDTYRTLKVGDKLEVRVREVDDLGRVNLTTLKEGEKPIPPQPRRDFQGGSGQGRPDRPSYRKFRDNR